MELWPSTAGNDIERLLASEVQTAGSIIAVMPHAGVMQSAIMAHFSFPQTLELYSLLLLLWWGLGVRMVSCWLPITSTLGLRMCILCLCTVRGALGFVTSTTFAKERTLVKRTETLLKTTYLPQ